MKRGAFYVWWMKVLGVFVLLQMLAIAAVYLPPDSSQWQSRLSFMPPFLPYLVAVGVLWFLYIRKLYYANFVLTCILLAGMAIEYIFAWREPMEMPLIDTAVLIGGGGMLLFVSLTFLQYPWVQIKRLRKRKARVQRGRVST
ncbi:MAG: hypothetical protein KJ052_00655 [Candidatus Hydrogenedentes bacterium]|nr:hypothetical protein [Candidatus Hydrogenedentota bacterium]